MSATDFLSRLRAAQQFSSVLIVNIRRLCAAAADCRRRTWLQLPRRRRVQSASSRYPGGQARSHYAQTPATGQLACSVLSPNVAVRINTACQVCRRAMETTISQGHQAVVPLSSSNWSVDRQSSCALARRATQYDTEKRTSPAKFLHKGGVFRLFAITGATSGCGRMRHSTNRAETEHRRT